MWSEKRDNLELHITFQDTGVSTDTILVKFSLGWQEQYFVQCFSYQLLKFRVSVFFLVELEKGGGLSHFQAKVSYPAQTI